MRRPGPYQVQAAIAAAPRRRGRRPAETDWREIAALYDALAAIDAVAGRRAQPRRRGRDGRRPGAGLALLDGIADGGALDDYHLPPRGAGRPAAPARPPVGGGRVAYRRALELTGNEAERDFLARRLAEVGG